MSFIRLMHIKIFHDTKYNFVSIDFYQRLSLSCKPIKTKKGVTSQCS